MPPKKKTDADTEADASGETLLILALGRNTGSADYEKFVSALPAGANFQGVRQRISKMRGEQKKKYEDMGWELTAEASLKAPSAKAKGEPKAKTEKGEKAKAPTKRKASADADEAGSGEGEGEGEAAEKPKAKKARARKGEGKKKAAAVKEEAKEGSEDEVEGAAVKQEGDEEAI